VSGLDETAKRDPVSGAALQALLLVAGKGRKDGPSGSSSKLKVARALKVKAEVGASNQHTAPSDWPQQPAPGNQQPVPSPWPQQPAFSTQPPEYGNQQPVFGNQQPASGTWPQQPVPSDWQQPNGGGGYRGRGGGRGNATGVERYGPPDTRSIEERKKVTSCAHCHVKGHWWKECEIRLAEVRAGLQAAAVAGPGAAPGNAAPAAAAAAGNGQRQ
jgi:hypothetical protein